jgi:4-hydroxy-tetrahydrodipicolinate reductase
MGTALKVGVFGAAGRMGSTVCEAVSAAEGMELVAAVDPRAEGEIATGTGLDGSNGLPITSSRETILDQEADVTVDFTVASVAVENALWCAAHRIHAVVGTTGVDAESMARVARAFPSDGSLGCMVVPNFAIGAVLMMRFAELAAPWFETAEILELHHDRKLDAPSGTAMLTAERMARASSEWADDPTQMEVLPGARGGEGPGGVHIHSVRLRGLVAHQEVLLGTTGQSLSIRHDSYDRESFMPGVLLAVREVTSRPGLTVGLESLLGI